MLWFYAVNEKSCLGRFRMYDRKRVGIDLDNTLIDYEEVFRSFARERGLVSPEFAGGKDDIREAARATPDGDVEWQRLQGVVYSKGIQQATLFEGAAEFLHQARDRGSEIFIVSHKTEFGHFDPDRINLRTAALEWMEAQGFFCPDGFAISKKNVLFAATRFEKIAMISHLGVSVFIDDLPEVLEDKDFPSGVRGILFTRGAETTTSDYPRTFTHWRMIAEMVFG
jgi:hypothetical protein